jgi:hypothetical protein
MAAIDTACLADGVANQLFTSLTADAPVPPTVDLSGPAYTFTVDETSDLYADINAVTLAELTEKDLDGAGVFDTLMASVDLHIQREFKGNRITGDQYAEVYTQAISAVLGQSVSFLLQKDQAKWSAIKAQMDARIAEIQATEALINLERTKVETQKAIFDMQNSGAEYGLTKMKIANADIEYCLTEAQRDSEVYKRNWLLPAELSLQEYQRNNMMPIEYAAKQVTADRLLPAQASIAEFENRVLQPIQEGTANFNLNSTLPTQDGIAQFQLTQLLPITLGKEQHLLNFQLPAQTQLLDEQKETARANTLDNRSDALTPITGSVGKQKDLYTQQIDSFIKDAQYKTGKMYLDGWITQKTLDENLAAPVELGVTSVSAILASLRSNNAL